MAGHRGHEYGATGKAIAHPREVQLAEPEVLLPSTVHVLVRGRVAPDRVNETALAKMHSDVDEMKRRVRAIDRRAAEHAQRLEQLERSTSEELRSQADRMEDLVKALSGRIAVLEAKVK